MRRTRHRPSPSRPSCRVAPPSRATASGEGPGGAGRDALLRARDVAARGVKGLDTKPRDAADAGDGRAPGLKQGQKQGEDEQGLPQAESGPGTLQGEQLCQKRGRPGDEAELEAPREEVARAAQLQARRQLGRERAHGFSLMRRERASSSSGVRCRSSTRCTRRGSGRAAEDPVHELADHRAHHLLSGPGGLVEKGAPLGLLAQVPLLLQHVHHGHDGGVGDLPSLEERLVHVAHGGAARAPRPPS